MSNTEKNLAANVDEMHRRCEEEWDKPGGSSENLLTMLVDSGDTATVEYTGCPCFNCTNKLGIAMLALIQKNKEAAQARGRLSKFTVH